ncbi:type IV pilin-like G/H family protein [Anabaena sphaerica FACHB-251]|uniref:Type IV pilin-like G/H family protein n=1 Tax=Anabaena sphaerica FACHB-251 TaxID=2692883 RepID=A0A926ZZ93_9NOST|nr:type IV pilin-like G/H family protein [Anabaena sphaerica]MBD2293497.1 type IV pilin-like G/H family protein [Anabaena sphaerica FACHB-251]
MKIKYSTKLIQYLIQSLIVMIVISVLSMIALQYTVSQGRTRLAISFMAKYHVYVINRIQEEYFLKHKKFANSIEELKSGIQFENPDYDYSTTATNGVSYSYGITKKQDSRSFIGAVFKIPAANKSEITTIAILCKNEQSGNIIPPQSILKKGFPICRAGTTEVK